MGEAVAKFTPRGRISANNFKNLTLKLQGRASEQQPALPAASESPPGPLAEAAAQVTQTQPPVDVAPTPVPLSPPIEVSPAPASAPRFKLPEFAPVAFVAPALEPSQPVALEESPPTVIDFPPPEPDLGAAMPEPEVPVPPETPAPAIVEFAAEADTPAAPDAEPAPEPAASYEPPAAVALEEPPQWIEPPEPEFVAEPAPAIEMQEAPPVTAEMPAQMADPPQMEFVPEAPPNASEPVAPPAIAAQTVKVWPAAIQRELRTSTALRPSLEAVAQGSSRNDRLYDAMIKTIADSVYARPTADERAAFLRDIAALAEREVSSRGDEPPEASNEVSTGEDLSTTPVEPAPGPVLGIAAEDAEQGAPSLRAKPAAPDPFARTFSPIADARPAETVGADEESGDLALSLLDMMSAGSSSGLPQERALAADTLLRILPRIPVKQLLAVVERVAIMEQPPALLVAKLIRDPRPEVVAPLLERCMHITDQDLIAAAREADPGKLRMMARRRVLSPVLADHLISSGDASVVLTLIRNPGAALSHDAFYAVAEIASQHHSLLAPLATRADLPAPVAFELFWFVPPELRRFIFSRFLTDSETLNKILRITLATYGGDAGPSSTEAKFPPRVVLDTIIGHIVDLRLDDAAQLLSEHAGISDETALRILSDKEGEPLAVIFKALGLQRAKFSEAVDKLHTADNGILRSGRTAEELQSIFDGLSFNKARILLTYWDWYVRKAGPYTPRH